VKTAISIPDQTFDRASRRAHDLGLSRSEFFTRAARHYLDELDGESTTRQINLALAQLDLPDEAAGAAVAAGRRVLLDSAGEW
jgi:metal-responsive CopG/Arc/MetJ family transcriptional regulator